MSEYQYYEFQAVDRPLTAEQMTRLRSLSSRAMITPTVIRDLHDLAARSGRLDSFMPPFEQLRTRHAKKVSLLQRLASIRLTPEQVGASKTGGGGREV